MAAGEAGPHVVGANPYLGLRPFGTAEAGLFFGRESQVERLVAPLGQNRFLAIVGSSGCGKSSLVLAGLVPALERGAIAGAGTRWRIVTMRPGNAPIAALAEVLAHALPDPDGLHDDAAARQLELQHTLARGELGLVDVVYQARLPDDENVLVIVDQFEELFNSAYAGGGAGADEAAAFVKLLLAATARADPPIFVALTMRSDFIGDCARFRDLAETVNAGLVLVPRLTRDEMQSAIEQPAIVRGATITPRLVSRLLNDIGSDSDQLPVLQHALMRTWAEWERAHAPTEPIDVPCYAAIGELEHALENHAEDIYDGLDPALRVLAEKLFRCITARDNEGRGQRRRTSFRAALEITGGSATELETLIRTYAAPGVAFLRPPGPPPYDAAALDISHESLMRLWKRLAEWVEKEAVAGQLYARLVDDATVPRALWIDPDLAAAEACFEADKHIINPAWAARYDPGLEKELARDARR